MRIILTAIISLFVLSSLQAQNPYKSIGKEAEVLTLSNGKYQEFIPNDTLVVIGSVIYNTVTDEVVAFAVPDTVLTELGFEPEVRSRFLSIDPYASKYPSISPYAYVANNPLIFIDPDGKEIRATTAAAQRMILNTLPKELRKHVVFNDKGYIDRTALNKAKSESGNFSALQQLVNDDRLFNVDIAEGFSHKDGFESFGDITMGDPSEAGPFSPQTGEQGWFGITLLPGEDGGYSSDGDYVNIVINSGLSEEGRAQIFSHEGYGHAYMFSKGENPNHVVVNVDGVFKETNRELANQIIRSIIETILNMEN